jgi:hypothetical protein
MCSSPASADACGLFQFGGAGKVNNLMMQETEQASARHLRAVS